MGGIHPRGAACVMCNFLTFLELCADGTARVYNAATGACVSILVGHEGEISKVQVGFRIRDS